MKDIYKGMWVLFGVAAFALIDYRLPAHGFEWVQVSEWWQALKVAVLYVLLPYLALRIFEIIVVGNNRADYGQVANLTTQVANHQQEHQQLSMTPQQELPPPQQELANHQQELLLVDDLPSWDIGNLTPAQGNPIPETDLDRDLTQAVLLYAQWGSYAKAATRLGGKITSEGIRQRVISAYQKDPQWVMTILPSDKLPKV